jgi:hypothetical protein
VQKLGINFISIGAKTLGAEVCEHPSFILQEWHRTHDWPEDRKNTLNLTVKAAQKEVTFATKCPISILHQQMANVNVRKIQRMES